MRREYHEIQSKEAEKCFNNFGESIILIPFIVFALLKTAMIVSITYKRWDWVYVLLGIAKRTSSNFGYIILFVSGDRNDNITDPTSTERIPPSI